MSNYSFNVTVNKPVAFEAYLSQNFTGIPYSDSIEDGTVIITTQTPLTDDQLASLTTIVDAYVDPAVYLELAHTESMIGVSQSNGGTGLADVASFIYESVFDSNGNSIDTYGDGSVLDAFKSILKITTTDVSQFSDMSTGSINIELWDTTRNMSINSMTVDISSIITAWQTLAQGGQTGPVTAYQSFMMFGLMNYGTNYDCIWIFRLSVSNTAINVRLNGLQKLFYFLI